MDAPSRIHSLVTTAWVAEHLEDPVVRLIQADQDELLYGLGHIPGATHLRWDTALQSPSMRDVLDEPAFARLMGGLGISPDTTCVLYGDSMNGWAAYAAWVLRFCGHRDVRLMDGGHAVWAREARPLTAAVPAFPAAVYPVASRRLEIRASLAEVMAMLGQPASTLVDARPEPQFEGQVFTAIGYPATGAHRGGHIPGAVNVPWTTLCDVDGRLKQADELRRLYAEVGADLGRPVTAYCIVGVGSAYTWFVLSELLGGSHVRNYDGSWMEWGSTMGVPVATARGKGI